MKTRDIIIGVVVILILGIGIYFLLQNGNEEEVVIEPTPTPVSVEDVEDKFNVDIPDDAETAEMRGEGTSALATRRIVGGLITLSILADLPDLNAGERYQAWLTKGEEGSDDFSRISLGNLRIAKGGYMIDFNSSDDLDGYDHIQVSRETNSDSTPDNVVLEGNF